MSLEEDLQRIARQEELLQFDQFDATTALDIGLRLKALIESRGHQAAIDIQLHGQPLFFYAMPGSTPSNVDWLRRKRNTVARFHKSSYAQGLSMQLKQENFMDRFGLSTADYVGAGGGFPLRVRGVGCIGYIGVSGLPQRDDHGVIVEVLAAVLGLPLEDLALPPA